MKQLTSRVIGTALCLGLGVQTYVAASAQGGEVGSSLGELTLEAPTLICLGMRCEVSGDRNTNACVALSYRREGAAEWKRALPLFRVKETAPGQWLFAGSVFDLEPDTGYELRAGLADPDGGAAEKTIKVRTRREPQAKKDGRNLHVVPGSGGGAGTEADPFKGLEAAQAAARPGDIFLVHAGVYPGTFSVARSGLEGAPIVWRGTGAGEAIIDGGGAERAIAADDAQYVFFENLTVRNAKWAIVAHHSQDVAVRRCRILGAHNGLTARKGAKNLYVADNLFEGFHTLTWPQGKTTEDRAIQVNGEGHAICFNRIRGFDDGIDTKQATAVDGEVCAVDFYNNDISECLDDGIEVDDSLRNTRCFRNRLTNCDYGISAQPVNGGPCYIFRNALYNVRAEPLKLHNNPSGILVLHNTFVKGGPPRENSMPLYVSGGDTEIRNMFFRNNIFLGAPSSYCIEMAPRMIACDLDYDGYSSGPYSRFAKWNGARYDTFGNFKANSGIEKHAVLLNPKTLFASGVQLPEDCSERHPLASLAQKLAMLGVKVADGWRERTVNDLRLKEGCAAIDAGQALPNVNDGFAGAAPDLGAIEYGEELPHYGPRP